MNLHALLNRRAAEGRPVRVGMIGAGKFGSMFLAQARRLAGIHVAVVADLDAGRARANMVHVGWQADRLEARDAAEALAGGSTHLAEDWRAAIEADVDVVVECTGDPVAAVEHCLAAYAAGRHVVNVTVEADALCGAALAAEAARAGVIHSYAYGDQPALVCDLVDWARACGFPVVAAGRSHKWVPHYRASTPATVWDHWGLTAEQAERGRLNPKMFNAFLDGSKPAIESAAIANACGLDAPSGGLAYPPGGADDLPTLMRPRAEGGVLERKGMVEVTSAIDREGEPVPGGIRNGVWVAFEGDDDYVRRCFAEYAVRTDPSGRYAALYKAWHLIGLELPVSVAAVGLRGEPTGFAAAFRADVAAMAKRDLRAGETLDGEGGTTVSGHLLPAADSVARGLLPLGLASGVRLARDVNDGACVRYDDLDPGSLRDTDALRLRRAMEAEARGHAG